MSLRSLLPAAASLALAALLLALAPAGLATDALAAKAKPSSTKVCKAKGSDGKPMSWTCGKDQACCINIGTGKGVCGMPGLGCF